MLECTFRICLKHSLLIAVVCYSYSLTYSPFHLPGMYCPSTTGCSAPSMPSIVLCLLLSCFRWFSPSFAMSSYHFLLGCPSSLILVATVCIVCPPIVLHSYYTSGPSPLLFQCVFCNVDYLCSFPDL